jgi:hypothetical protein
LKLNCTVPPRRALHFTWAKSGSNFFFEHSHPTRTSLKTLTN